MLVSAIGKLNTYSNKKAKTDKHTFNGDKKAPADTYKATNNSNTRSVKEIKNKLKYRLNILA